MLTGVPTLPLAKVEGAAQALASTGQVEWRRGNSAHVLVVLALALPRVEAAITATGVRVGELRAAADAAGDRDFAFGAGGGLWHPGDFLRAAFGDPETVLGRLALAYGWNVRDIEAICDGAGGLLPETLPGMVRGPL